MKTKDCSKCVDTQSIITMEMLDKAIKDTGFNEQTIYWPDPDIVRDMHAIREIHKRLRR